MKRFMFLSLGLCLALAMMSTGARAAPFAYISNLNGNNVTVIDVAVNKVVATIPVQSHPIGVAVKPDGTRVFVSNRDSNTVTAIDALTNSVIKHIPVGAGPHGMAIKKDGSRLYVVSWTAGSISVIDTRTNAVLTTIGGVGASLHGAVLNPAGTRLYCSRTDYDQVVMIDTATNTVTGSPIPVGDAPCGIAFTPNGARAYVVNEKSNNVSVIDTATNTAIATVPVEALPYLAVVNPQGTLVYVGNRNSDTVSVIDTATNEVVGIIQVGDSPHGLDFNPTGTRLYVANYLSNNVTVVNAVNNTVITSIPVTGNSPVAMGRFMGPAPAPAKTVKVSLGNNGKGLDGDSYQASISADGRFVVFGYANRIYLRDRATRTLSRIDGRYDLATGEWHWGNDVSSNPVISPNGRYVAYQSEAWNLDPDGLDNNGLSDIFRYDRITREIKTISKHRGGLGTATGESIAPSVSNDGGVAFASNATDLVPSGEKTTRAWDVFVGWGASVQRVSTASAPANTEGNGDALQPAISASGQFVTFISSSSNLVAGDTNNAWDVFVRDRGANTTTRVSIATGAAGAQGNLDSWQPAISGDGRYVAFASDATNLVTPDLNDVADIFVRDRTQNKTYLVSVDARGAQGDGPSYSPAISPDGRYVAFESYAALDPLDFNEVADIYLRDRTAKQTSRLSVSTRGVEGNGDSLRPSMSADGRHVAFDSLANNLVSGDYFGEESNWDIFVRDRGVGTTPAYPASAPLEPQPIK